MAGEVKPRVNLSEKSPAFYRAERLASLWLYRANLAAEKGDHELEQRHLSRAQPHLDKMNRIDGLV